MEVKQDKILVIVPTRDRPHNILELYTSWIGSGHSDLLFAVDDDQYDLYMENPILEAGYTFNPRIRLIPTLNKVALEWAPKYRAVAFLGDDHRFRTPDWDVLMLNAIDNMGGTGIVYGDDLFKGEGLPTAVCMSSNIIETLGYMAPPCLIHMYADDAWLRWGREIDRVRYMPEVVIEHMHFGNGKAEVDDLYRETNFSNLLYEDQARYEKYLANDLSTDMEKLRGLL